MQALGALLGQLVYNIRDITGAKRFIVPRRALAVRQYGAALVSVRPGSVETQVVVRGEILEVTLTLLKEGGIRAVTMRAIARRLDVDPMALYHYFSGKDTLLKAVAEKWMSRIEVNE